MPVDKKTLDLIELLNQRIRIQQEQIKLANKMLNNNAKRIKILEIEMDRVKEK